TALAAAPAGGAAGQPVVIVDERQGAAPQARREPEPGAAGPVPGRPVPVRPGPGDLVAPRAADLRSAAPAPEGPLTEPVPPFAPSIAARDARQGPAAWIGSIGAQLELFREDGRPFAVLLIE